MVAEFRFPPLKVPRIELSRGSTNSDERTSSARGLHGVPPGGTAEVRGLNRSQTQQSKLDVLATPAPEPLKGFVYFDVKKFKELLSGYFKQHSSSWAYSIHYHNVSVGVDWIGFVQFPPDLDVPPLHALLTPDRRIDTASNSKTLTAIAVIRLLGQMGRNLDDIIEPEFKQIPPPYLNPDPNFFKLTYRKLLRHQTGLSSSIETGGQSSLFIGVNNTAIPAMPKHEYANANYALLRYAAYFLLGYSYSGITDLSWQAGPAFCEYLRRLLFVPLGINNVTWGPAGQFSVVHRAYLYPADGTAGRGPGPNEDGQKNAGAGWVYLSLEEYLLILDALWAGLVLSPLQRAEMTSLSSTFGCGCFGATLTHPSSLKMQMYSHNGDAYYDDPKIVPYKYVLRHRWVSIPAFKFSVAAVSNRCDSLVVKEMGVTKGFAQKVGEFFIASLNIIP